MKALINGLRSLSSRFGGTEQAARAPVEDAPRLDAPIRAKLRTKRKRSSARTPNPLSSARQQAGLILQWAQLQGMRQITRDEARDIAWPAVCRLHRLKPAAWGGWDGVAKHLGILGKGRRLRDGGEGMPVYFVPAGVTPLHPPRSPTSQEIDARAVNFAQDGLSPLRSGTGS